MHPYYYKAPQPNVGDDLNSIIWRKLIPNIERERRWDWLIGIGTILDQRIDGIVGKKLIVGSGVRPTPMPLSLDECDIAFVRGKLSAEALGLSSDLVGCDPGFFATECFPKPKITSTVGVGFIPHYHTLSKSSIARYLKSSDVHLISPSLPLDDFFKQLAACDAVLCEAMHGAIFAESLGIPWRRVKLLSHRFEGASVSEFKWSDSFSPFKGSENCANPVSISLLPNRRRWAVLNHISSWIAARRLRVVGAQRDQFSLIPVLVKTPVFEYARTKIDELFHS